MPAGWYADALSYKNRGRAMTGLVYRHEPMGALPVGHYSLMNLEKLNVQEELSYSYEPMLHIYPCEHVFHKTEHCVIGFFLDSFAFIS